MGRRARRKTKSKASSYVCPNCGYKIKKSEIRKYLVKERFLTSVSFSGKVTITMLGSVECPKCGKRFRVVLGKKSSDSSGKSPKERVIEVIKKAKRISLEDLSKKTKFSVRALRIALEGYIKDGSIKGHFEGDVFVLDERMVF